MVMPVSGQGRMPSKGRFHLSWNLTFPQGISFTKSHTIPLFINRFFRKLLWVRGSIPCSALSSSSPSSCLYYHAVTLWAAFLSSILLSLRYIFDVLGVQNWCLFRLKPCCNLEEKHTKPRLSMTEESDPQLWKLQNSLLGIAQAHVYYVSQKQGKWLRFCWSFRFTL